MHLPKPKHYCIVRNEQPQALASMSMQTKQNTYALLKQADISTQGGNSMKLVDKFTCLGSSVSSTEKDYDPVTNIGMDRYQLAIGHMEVRPDQ